MSSTVSEKSILGRLAENGLISCSHIKTMDELLPAYRQADSEEKTRLRFRITSVFWDMYAECFIKGIASIQNPDGKSFLRTGVVDYSLLSEAQQSILKFFIDDDDNNHGIFFFIDEWLRDIIAGKVQATTGDDFSDVKKMQSTSQFEKISAEIAVEKEYLIDTIIKHNQAYSVMPVVMSQITNEYDRFIQILDEFKDLLQTDSDITMDTGNIELLLKGQKDNFMRLASGHKQLEKMQDGIKKSIDKLLQIREKKKGMTGSVDNGDFDNRQLKTEVGLLRQMHKLCCGPRGNHFPLPVEDYFPLYNEQVFSRKKLLEVIGKVDFIDPGVFIRTFKGTSKKIYPYFILLPSYGENGICWEPFDKRNRATSQGRLVLPIFSRRSHVEIILSALADFRWQIQKESLGHHWLSEGLTGIYNDHFIKNKFKGDAKEKFISDYIVWIESESKGIQKLDKEVRAIFWRYLPFPDDVKNSLSKFGFVYKNLIEKDKRRSMSQGY